MGTKEMTLEEIQKIQENYREEYVHTSDYEHRYDNVSSRILYALIRKYKPVNLLEIGTWRGGSTSTIMQALIKNGGEFSFIGSELLKKMRVQTKKNLVKELGIAPQMIGDITKNLDKIPSDLDFLMIDTDHDLETTRWIFENILPKCKKGALVSIHDWAVEERDGKLLGKGEDGVGGWPETDYIMDLYRKGELPLEKLFWTYGVTGPEESSFWTKI
jgi:predicted O-methyltransferase YrrM